MATQLVPAVTLSGSGPVERLKHIFGTRGAEDVNRLEDSRIQHFIVRRPCIFTGLIWKANKHSWTEEGARQAGGDGWWGSATQLHSQKTLRQTDRKTTAQCLPHMDTNLLVILKSNIYMMNRKKPEAGPLKMKSKTKHMLDSSATSCYAAFFFFFYSLGFTSESLWAAYRPSWNTE